MTNREKRADAYTEEGELKPLSWGRARIARKAAETVEELTDEDGASLAAAIYLMDFQELRKIPSSKLIEVANDFADPLDAKLVIACGTAFGRDMGALDASEVQAPAEGKQTAPEVGHNHSETPASLQLA